MTLTSVQTTFKIKSKNAFLTTIYILSDTLDILKCQLQTAIQQAPQFFQNTPILIDLSALTAQDTQSFCNLIQELCLLLQAYGMLPIAVQCAGRASHQLAKTLNRSV